MPGLPAQLCAQLQSGCRDALFGGLDGPAGGFRDGGTGQGGALGSIKNACLRSSCAGSLWPFCCRRWVRRGGWLGPGVCVWRPFVGAVRCPRSPRRRIAARPGRRRTGKKLGANGSISNPSRNAAPVGVGRWMCRASRHLCRRSSRTTGPCWRLRRCSWRPPSSNRCRRLRANAPEGRRFWWTEPGCGPVRCPCASESHGTPVERCPKGGFRGVVVAVLTMRVVA